VFGNICWKIAYLLNLINNKTQFYVAVCHLRNLYQLQCFLPWNDRRIYHERWTRRNRKRSHQNKSCCSTVHFRRIASVYQPTNAHIISHKTVLKHSDMFRSCQIIIRELCSLLKLYYSIHNSIRICKRGVVAAYHVAWECVVEQWLGVRRTTHT